MNVSTTLIFRYLVALWMTAESLSGGKALTSGAKPLTSRTEALMISHDPKIAESVTRIASSKRPNVLTEDEAWRVASNIAKLPDLLVRLKK